MSELLAPCGSNEALNAAIAAGADAVYFGASSFNARMNAENFKGDILKNAIAKCRSFGIKTNITVNTLIYDREMYSFLKTVEQLYTLGADAFIVADLGAAALMKKYFPDIVLHASTQVSGHNVNAAKVLKNLGFSRMVAARELSFDDLKTLCDSSPIETELFIHGAICVSQSGQCLASSLIGGRSGNRGECAQPCRLPYSCGAKSSYPLSLKDICLASHIPELLSLNAASFKIEGRMKSPEYVYGVVKIYRSLIDEKRNADAGELKKLKSLFSRSGFTDGYFTDKISVSMLGVRTESDKADSLVTENADYSKLIENRRRKCTVNARIKSGQPSTLELICENEKITVTGDIPYAALNRPLDEKSVGERLAKLGGTPFYAQNINVELDEGLLLPVSSINKLRRDAVEELVKKLTAPVKCTSVPENIPLEKCDSPKALLTARFSAYGQIPPNEKFDICYLPLEKYQKGMCDRVNGIILPPVIFDSEIPEIKKMLALAAEDGIKNALVSNIGHIELAKRYGFVLHGDYRLNIYNSHSARVFYELGFADLLASPELTVSQIRDIGIQAVIYGRIPLMTLEKCVIRDLYSCEMCKRKGLLVLTDRRHKDFLLERCYKHRNILYNSVPTYMLDRKKELENNGIYKGHFIFTNENAGKVLFAYENELPPEIEIRRIK